mmetsp:Transcript_119692/g.298501  ORF Transcript_119692/g.298501 Transcript_119692/m.298501 type:complete len:228 (+) Transcript_119692:60-743(+)|eukprot:CAMPEP_0115274098 /NCGR_PEP_ID=MMETSP0270-20121206/55493_1 /TAXON_ID=71861 /ORGANISM="Scrippsiella trochoidea, Strain CCMP3099" /LENGTH=227 /DNA_ID=CAMNT_0002690585 /DNA_START=58 /DNA_END=741 /DNA_ORIENTATION=+
MARPSRIVPLLVLGAAAYSATQLFIAFVGVPSTTSAQGSHLRLQGLTAVQARGGGEYDVSDADIERFYAELTNGVGGEPPKGNLVSEMIVKFFHGEFTTQGFKRYSGLWKGPPPGNIGKKDIAVGLQGLKEQMKNPMFVTKGGVGYGVDESQKVVDDGKGWVWLAAEMSPGGLSVELLTSVPYGKRAILVAKQSNVDEMFAKVNWDQATTNIGITLGGPHQTIMDGR